MKRMLRYLKWATAIATVAAALALCLICVDIYIEGNRAENLTADGVYKSPIYSAENVRERLSPLALPLGGYILLVGITGVAQMRTGSENKLHVPKKFVAPKENIRAAEKSAHRRVGRIRAVMYAAALVFIVLGVMNGGLRDVFVKAINICTECIGLG